MLWNSIFEFFVKYVFGGSYGGTLYSAYLGVLYNKTSHTNVSTPTYQIEGIVLSDGNNSYSMSLGNYLSLIATIISIVSIVIICIIIIKKIFSICFNLFTGRSIF